MYYPIYLSYVEDPAISICESGSTERYPLVSASRLHHYPQEELESIRLVLRRLTAVRISNKADAEDLVQETLLTVSQKLPQVNLRKGLLAWSLGVLRKKVGNYYRKAQRSPRLYTDADRHPYRRKWSWTACSPESRLLQKEFRRLVDKIVSDFPARERLPLELSLAGMDTCDIARQLRPVPYQNVINRLHRARRRLIRELIRQGYGPASRGYRSAGRPNRVSETGFCDCAGRGKVPGAGATGSRREA